MQQDVASLFRGTLGKPQILGVKTALTLTLSIECRSVPWMEYLHRFHSPRELKLESPIVAISCLIMPRPELSYPVSRSATSPPSRLQCHTPPPSGRQPQNGGRTERSPFLHTRLLEQPIRRALQRARRKLSKGQRTMRFVLRRPPPTCLGSRHTVLANDSLVAVNPCTLLQALLYDL
jgi:hypothetical protein